MRFVWGVLTDRLLAHKVLVRRTLRPRLDFLICLKIMPRLTSAIVSQPPPAIVRLLVSSLGVLHRNLFVCAAFRRALRRAIGVWHGLWRYWKGVKDTSTAFRASRVVRAETRGFVVAARCWTDTLAANTFLTRTIGAICNGVLGNHATIMSNNTEFNHLDLYPHSTSHPRSKPSSLHISKHFCPPLSRNSTMTSTPRHSLAILMSIDCVTSHRPSIHTTHSSPVQLTFHTQNNHRCWRCDPSVRRSRGYLGRYQRAQPQ